MILWLFKNSSRLPSWNFKFQIFISTVDYIMVRQEDKAKIRNVKVITSEECTKTQTVSNGYAI